MRNRFFLTSRFETQTAEMTKRNEQELNQQEGRMRILLKA